MTITTNNDQTSTGQYAAVNGLNMYYEVHGTGEPLVLIHGAFSAIGTSWGALIPELARTRQVIALEMQAHGRTADIDRPMRVELMADDTAAIVRQLGFERADVMGYSMGAAVALQVAIRHPEVVRKLVLLSVTYRVDGMHPGLMDGFEEMKPEMMYGSPWHDEYMRIAPDPTQFDATFAKKNEMDRNTQDVPAEAIQALTAPVLLIAGDSDIVRPEHAVEMFRLLGGGVFGDMAGMPNSQLAILPGVMHTTAMIQTALLVPMLNTFLDAPMPAAQ